MTPEQRAEQILQNIRSQPGWRYHLSLLCLGVFCLGGGLFLICYVPEGGLGAHGVERLIAAGTATMVGGFVFLAAYFLARIRSRRDDRAHR
jgi:hypothetical protein